jgi:hypothetical protein
MIISDLNYLEVVSEDVRCVEGSGAPLYIFPPIAQADSLAKADALGYLTQTQTFTKTAGVAGLFSSSLAASSSYAVG